MKRRLMAFCAAVVVASVSFTVSGSVTAQKECINVSYAERVQYYNEAADMNTTRNEAADMNSTTGNNSVDNYLDNKNEGLSNSAGLIGSLLGGIGGDSEDGSDSGLGIGSGGGIGDAIGGIGDAFAGILGGGSDDGSAATTPATYPVGDYGAGYIDPVPAATYVQDEITVNTPAATQAQSVAPQVVVSENETINPSATTNPYKKPAGTINPGDSGEGVKWMQWIFIYTGYGLEGKSVTGVYDEETEALVRKFQEEKGLTVDGIVNDAVIDKIELLYYEYSVTATTASQASVITAPDTIGTAQPNADGGQESGSLGIVIAVVAAIWCVAIIIILAIFIAKKKKKKNSEKNTAEAATEEKTSEATGSAENKNDMNLSDLFEDANKKE